MSPPITSLLCVLGFAAIAGGAHAQPRDFPTSEQAAVLDTYPERVTQFPNQVIGRADVVYSTVPGFRPLVLDLYIPPGTTPRPLILYIHGGGWTGGHTRHGGAITNFPHLLAALASEGFVVASLEYRLAGEAVYPAQMEDAQAALRFLRSNAARFGLDPARVGVWGGSAGGQLAAMLGVACGGSRPDLAPASEPVECVQAAAVWYGVFDFAQVIAASPQAASAASPVAALLGCPIGDCSPDVMARASPITFVDPSDPPFLLVHGQNDRTAPAAQSRAMEARLRADSVSVTADYIANVDHSFIGSTPEETHAATMRAVNLTFDFFHRTLGQPRQ